MTAQTVSNFASGTLGAFLGILLAFSVSSPNPKVDYQAMVDRNFIVNNGCSGTLMEGNAVLTAAHCVRNMKNGSLVPLMQELVEAGKVTETRYRANLVYTDANADLALLLVEGDLGDLSPATVGDNVALGDEVIVVGNPGRINNIVTKGIVSRAFHPVTMQMQYHLELFRSDVDIAPGNSGGAVYNSRGELVGVSSIATIGPGMSLGGFTTTEQIRDFLEFYRRVLNINDHIGEDND